MHPSGPPLPPQNRSSPSPSLPQCPSPSPSLLQQQQHVIYGPITSLHPCPTSLHPHCLYTGVQRNPGFSGLTSATLSNQVPIRQTKVTKWQPKSRPARGYQHHYPNQQHYHHHHQQSHQQQYCQPLQHQQTHVQQPLSYIPKPLVLFDQCPANQPPAVLPPSANSFLISSSAYAHAPYGPGDPYSTTSGVTLIPQPYFKPPAVSQTFCLLPERSQTSQQHQQSLVGQPQGSYYNISAPNACGFQSINPKPAFQLTNVVNSFSGTGATFGSSQIAAGQALPPSQIFQNQPVNPANFGTTTRDKLPMLSSVDVEALTCSRNLIIPGETKHRESMFPSRTDIEWPGQMARETSSNICEVPDAGTSSRISLSPNQTNRLHSTRITKNQDERYSDESAASFDFTIEAEKMVSALCNTASSNDLIGKDETGARNEQSAAFEGAAGDNVNNKTNAWFADFCNEYGVSVGQNNRAVSTQTQEDRHDPQRYPEMLRKTIYWGCNEAESILKSKNYRDIARAKWLENISSATRTAVTKSSTSFPIYAGDKIFVQDLVNALLRICNGWLILDNYLNKQHYPSLDDKFNGELKSCFQTWEVTTLDLTKELVKAFVNLEENNVSNCSLSLERIGHQENSTNSSFPGDVNLYTNKDLFDSSQDRAQDHNSSKLNNCPRITDRDSTYTLQYAAQSTNHPNFHSYESQQKSQKETKLRSKWTITENLSSTIDSSTKSIPDLSIGQTDPGFTNNGRFRVKNLSNASTTKITSSSRRSLNAEFFHLRNKVMEGLGDSNDRTDRKHWGLKEQKYDFVFGTSRGNNSSAILPVSCEPMFKITTAANSYENRRCLPQMDSTNPVNQTPTNHHCAKTTDKSIYHVGGGVETAPDATYIAGPAACKDRNKIYAEPDCTGNNARTNELNEHNCGSGLAVSVSSISSSLSQDPVYVGKSTLEEHGELATTVPRTKMTLLSQIEGNTPNTNRDTKEMTANLSAWFASMRNFNGHRTINCPIEGRKNDNITMTRTSSHPQETSRSAMDLNRQLHMDGNRQLQTIQNMQAIQSQPWNASNLLNNKRTTNNGVTRQLDEYDSSEDVRVYMKPGSYNVPKKRQHRKNTRRGENPGSSRVNNNTPRGRVGYSGSYNVTSGKNNHQVTSAVSSLIMASSVQVSTTTTATSTTIRVPFPEATPIVPPPVNFSLQNSPKILRRTRSFSNHETRQDVAWKAACASAEILLEALNVKASTKGTNSNSPNSMKNAQNDFTPRNQDGGSLDRLARKEETVRYLADDDFDEASSYEVSEDDSSSTCKLSSDRYGEEKSCDSKLRTNVKTDSWLIRTLNNVSIVSTINAKESDAESTIDGSLNSSIHDDHHREHKTVVTSTPEPVKITIDENDSTNVSRKLDDSFHEKSVIDDPQERKNRERSRSNDRQTPSRTLSVSLIDTSGEFVNRATYSETVRRSTGKFGTSDKAESCRSGQTRSIGSIESTIGNSMIPVTGKKFQRKENEKNHQSINKSKKIVGKKGSRDIDEEKEIEEGLSSKKNVKEDSLVENTTKHSIKSQIKKKEDGGSSGGWTETKAKCNERGWSIWYSSRRKQTLSSLALNKLATIHQIVWQMDDAKLLKYPSSSSSCSVPNNEVIEDDFKIIKSPIFLETVGYKLKNRIYHKVEQAIRDFRKIVNNSKLQHKSDTDRIAKIETLSKKLEELFEEHFTNSDYENVVTDSPRNNNGLSGVQTSRCKSPQQRQHQKSTSSRTSSLAKKNSATLTKNEN